MNDLTVLALVNRDTQLKICEDCILALKEVRQYMDDNDGACYVKDKPIVKLRSQEECDKMNDVCVDSIFNPIAFLNVYIKKAENILSDTENLTQCQLTLLVIGFMYIFPTLVQRIREQSVNSFAVKFFDIVPLADRINWYMGGVIKEKFCTDKKIKKKANEISYAVAAKTGHQIYLTEIHLLSYLLNHPDASEEDIKFKFQLNFIH